MESTSRLLDSGFRYACDLVAIHLRNVEALRLAQYKVLDSMSVLTQRQAEIAEATVKRSFGTPAAAPPVAPGLPEAVIGQVERFKTALLESQANSNLLSELAARGSGEVAALLQSRMVAALDEFTAALTQAMAPQAQPVAAAPLALAAPVGAPA